MRAMYIRKGHQSSGFGRCEPSKGWELRETNMGWWPFKRRKAPIIDNPHLRSTRSWLTDLRELCERHFDNPAEGQRLILQMQVEWDEACAEGDIPSELHEGLRRRAFRLLNANAKEWLEWLDDDSFWQPGWRGDDGVPNDSSG